MARTILIILLGLALIGGSVFFVVSSSSDSDVEMVTTPSTSTETSDSASAEGQATTGQTTGRYVDYSEQALSSATEKNKVIFFHAPWCPTCQALDRNIKAGRIPEDLVILKLDYDSNQDLRQKYGVTFQHTLIQVDANGNEINQWSGSYDIDEIVEQLS